jgi:pimeloyl-ACP methyl ester carboxylesterase
MRYALSILIAIVLVPPSFTRADAITDRITVAVKGNGPDILLIPGMTCSASVWDNLADHLQAHYRLHLIQVAGFASAPAAANAKGPVLMPTIEAIDAYIKQNKLAKPTIIGHSIGGFMGLALADKHPEDVGRLLIVDSLPFFSVLFGATDAASVKAQAAAIRDSMINETQDAYAEQEKQFLPQLVKSPEGLKLAIKWALASDKSVVAQAFYETMTSDLRPRLVAIKTPITILYPFDAASGMPQSAIDKMYQDNFAALPNKKLVRIDGSYHFIMFDQPTAFAAQVDQFLRSH